MTHGLFQEKSFASVKVMYLIIMPTKIEIFHLIGYLISYITVLI